MRFHVACPHCGEEQYLKFGDKETPFGLKWTPDDPSSVFYLCEHNACVIRQQELDFTDARYICEKTGIWTRDGILWFSSSGEEIEPPDSVTFHIWTAYSPFTTWVQIVKDWMKTKGDTGKRKTFVNTTLGETWEAKIGERPDAEVMAERKEHYSAPVGISRLTDAVSGDSLTAGEAPAALALSVDDDGPRQARSYQVMNGIAVLPVSGTLVSRTRALQPYSGMTGYNGIIARLQQAASDPMVDGILLDMDTPGGMVAGAFDCADIIARVRDIKPVPIVLAGQQIVPVRTNTRVPVHLVARTRAFFLMVILRFQI